MTDPKVDPIFENATQWKEPMLLLRELVLEAGLTEACKWRQACYTYKGTNVAISSAFKEYCSLNFFKGSLLKDPEGMLIQHTENEKTPSKTEGVFCIIQYFKESTI